MVKVRTKSRSVSVIDQLPPPKQREIPLPKGWRRSADALDKIEVVSTIFPDFNRATRCGGLPINRMHTVHGVTHGGKSAFVIGLIKSFLDGGHAGAYIDAEHSTPQEFAAELMGDLQKHPNFFGKAPDTYEDTIDAVNEFLKMMTVLRKDEPGRKCIVVVDTVNKLTPERELKNVLKSGGEEVSKGSAGRYRAAVTQAWLNHLSPRLKPAGCAMVFVAQEREQADAQPWDVDGGVEIKGGQALSFDASMLIRVSKSIAVRDMSTATENNKGAITGFAHRVRIYKSKVSHMDGAFSDCTYHFSNGAVTPAGFDTARDAVMVGKRLGLVTVSGSWLTWNKRRWQGEMKGVLWLSANADALHGLLSEIERVLAEQRRKHLPAE